MTDQPVPASVPAPEDVNRGTVVALLAIPVGIIVFVLIWSIGFIASAVTLGVAYLARFLYVLGSGGGISRLGAIRVAIITIVTVILSVVAGLISDVALGISQVTDLSPIEALTSSRFSEVFTAYLTEPELQYSPWPSVLIALAFGAIGCFSLLRATLRGSSAPSTTAQGLWQTPTTPPAEETPPR